MQRPGRALRMAPGHTGVDLRANLQLANAQRLHAGARGFAARHHQLLHAGFGQRARNGGQRALDQRPRLRHPQARLDGLDRFGRGQIDRMMSRAFAASPPDSALMREPSALADYARGYRMFLTGRIAGYVDGTLEVPDPAARIA